MAFRHSLKNIVFVTALALLMAGCGRENKVYDDPNDQNVVVDETALLPDDFADLSVNKASAQVSVDQSGGTIKSVLRLKTELGSNPSGGFSGPGSGNRAILGISRFDQKLLTDLFLEGGIALHLRAVSGEEKVKVLLLADLQCDSKSIRTLIADTSADHFSGVDLSDYAQLNITSDAEIWQVAGSDLIDPLDASVKLIESTSSGTRKSLDLLLAHYPDSCIRNFAYADQDLPSSLTLPGIMISLGNTETVSLNEVNLSRLVFGSETFENLEWSTP